MTLSSFLRRAFRIAALVLLLSMLPWAAAQSNVQAASAPQPEQPAGWISFGAASAPQPASLDVVSAKANAIDMRALIPGAWSETRGLLGAEYAYLYADGMLGGHPQGMPALPVLRRDIEIPLGASYTLQIVNAQSRMTSLADLGLPAQYFPQQPAQPKCGDVIEPCGPDAKLYASKGFYPEQPVRVINEYVVRGHRVVTVEIWPVAYAPINGALRLYSDIQFRLALEDSNLPLTEAMSEKYASPAFETSLASSILNYNQGRGARTFGSRTPVYYLIITANVYQSGLANFVALKQSQGFTVTVANLTTAGSTTDAIKAYITTQYQSATPPTYVLLVGDHNDGGDSLPAFPFPSYSGKYTDLYYATMDGTSDFVPDILRGRFPVRDTAQLANMVSNNTTYDNYSGQEPWVKKISFLATGTDGDYDLAEGTHNYCINTYTQPKGYTGIFPNNPQAGGDKLYAYTYSASGTNVVTSVNDARAMVVYSGHGSDTSWANPPFSQSNVQNITNGVLIPYVVGHACVTSNFRRRYFLW